MKLIYPSGFGTGIPMSLRSRETLIPPPPIREVESPIKYDLMLLGQMQHRLSHDQDTIHAKKGCEEMCNFYMAALMFLTGHGIEA